MGLINELAKLQELRGYLPAEGLEEISRICRVPIAKVYSVASFYGFFTFSEGPRQDHIERLYPLRKEGGLLKSSDQHRWEALRIARQAPEKVIGEISASGLAGRSGGGFPAGVKWKLTAETDAPVKYVVCNADEGEPGTGKDRVILERNPWSVVEGMAICAKAVGAKEGFLYLRGEYADLKESLEAVIREAPLEDLSLRVVLGNGAYICGEETALVNALEDRRGETRLKPPFPGVAGLYGKPTVVNNAETFCCVPMIIREKAGAFIEQGAEGYAGPKLFTVFGAVKAPGVYELKPGITIAACIEEAGGASEPIRAILTGGGSGTLLPPSALDIPMTPKACQSRQASFGVASIRVIGESEDLVTEVRKLMDFFCEESCGTCVPCRVGLQRIRDLLKKMEKGEAYPEDLDMLKELCSLVAGSARCGLGLAAVTPVRTLLENFAETIK